jgi:hypothetical protein
MLLRIIIEIEDIRRGGKRNAGSAQPNTLKTTRPKLKNTN